MRIIITYSRVAISWKIIEAPKIYTKNYLAANKHASVFNYSGLIMIGA